MNRLKSILPIIKQTLSKKGYQVIKLSKPGRHFVGKVKKNEKVYLFKMAADPQENKNIVNEHKMDAFLRKNLSDNPDVIIRRHTEKGAIEYCGHKLKYFICDYIGEGQDLSIPSKKTMQDAARLAYSISQIVSVNADGQDKQPDMGERVYGAVSTWIKETRIDEKAPLSLVAKYKGKLKTTFGHGDFAPWHLYKIQDKLTIIDTELAGEYAKYYDVANFYLRLRQNVGNKKHANIFLREYIKLLPATERAKFWREFKPVLTERTLGFMWEKKNRHGTNKVADPVSYKRVLKEILTNTIASRN